MALHFSQIEFDRRMECVQAAMGERGLDVLLIFAQESMYWLTGYDTFGFSFFQCLVLTRDGNTILLTRSADLRQARQTSTIEDIRVWTDRSETSPAIILREILYNLDLLGAQVGIEYDTHGLTALSGRHLDDHLRTFAELQDASDIIPKLRLVKSTAEIAFIRDAAQLTDAAWEAGVELLRPGVDEADILTAMQAAVLAGGGDYPANNFIIGSGPDALLCRYKTGRRKLSASDQMTLEFAGVYRHYHVAAMRTVIIGEPTERHLELHDAARTALAAVEDVMRPGHTFGDVFNAHAAEIDARGLHAHRLNACGYSLGARFAPSWMDWPMFFRGNEVEIAPNMCLFAHMILMDSDSGTAICLGQTYLTTDNEPQPVCSADLDLVIRP
jgi:Xaa-Pro dipeptidase